MGGSPPADYEGPLRRGDDRRLLRPRGADVLLLTNQLTATAARLIERYARRMIIENNIEDGIDFFHMDALLGGGHEGRLRPPADPDGQQPVPPAGREDRPWL